MGFTYCVEEYEEHLRFIGQGAPATPQEMFRYVSFMFNKAKQSGHNRILVDESRTNIRFGFHDTVISSKLIDSEEFTRHDMRVAIVCAPHSLDMYKFFESTLRKNSFDIRTFDNVEDGLEWLGIDEGS